MNVIPRVARGSQPWALVRNPFGIEESQVFGGEEVAGFGNVKPGSSLLSDFHATARSNHAFAAKGANSAGASDA
jgi:hypothetical protein